MPTPRQTTSQDLSDQELLAPVWCGRKTGNLFKVTSVERDPDEGRMVNYKRATGEAYRITYAKFVSRFRPATEEDLWQRIESTAAAASQDGETNDLLQIVEPDHRHDLDRLVLHDCCRAEISAGLNRVTRAAELEEVWKLSQIEPRANRCVLNFYGPPGTGKTMAAVSIAKKLGKTLMKVDYASIVSKYVGDTAKHIRAAFQQAAATGAVLMFDEADAIMSRRLSFDDSSDGASVTGINQNRNVLLNELDAFNGVVIMCTNRFGNYDEALLRRTARHVHFELPNQKMLKQLLLLHLPALDRVRLTENEIHTLTSSMETAKFSGGDVLNVAINAITRCSLSADSAEWALTFQDLKLETRSIEQSKKTHGA